MCTYMIAAEMVDPSMHMIEAIGLVMRTPGLRPIHVLNMATDCEDPAVMHAYLTPVRRATPEQANKMYARAVATQGKVFRFVLAPGAVSC